MRACKSGFQERKIIHASGKGRGRKRIKRIGPSSSTRSIRIRFFIYCPISNRKMLSWSFVSIRKKKKEKRVDTIDLMDIHVGTRTRGSRISGETVNRDPMLHILCKFRS